jgi:hypothetical protein
MKISFDEILPPDVLLHAGTQDSSNCSISGRIGPKCTFSTIDLENDGQGHTFSKSKYQKRVVSEKLKILSYHTYKSDVWFGL